MGFVKSEGLQCSFTNGEQSVIVISDFLCIVMIQ